NQEQRIKTLEEKINNQEELKLSTNTNVKPKEPALWVSIQIKNTFNSDNIYIKNARLEFGKFVQNEDKYMEIGSSDLLSTIPAGQTGTISSASRTNSASGTEGTIDLFDADVKIAQLYWNCPFGSQENTFKVIDLNSKDGYIVNVGDVNRSSALGIINVEVGFRH
ncbi:MAG: aegerolysin family protein, partial [Nostoc sp.]